MISFSFSTKASFSFFSESVWEERKRYYEGWKRERERGGNIFRCTARIKELSFIFLLLSLCLGVWFCFSFDLIIFKANQL